MTATPSCASRWPASLPWNLPLLSSVWIVAFPSPRATVVSITVVMPPCAAS
jgi:hypothetical protein